MVSTGLYDALNDDAELMTTLNTSRPILYLYSPNHYHSPSVSLVLLVRILWTCQEIATSHLFFSRPTVLAAAMAIHDLETWVLRTNDLLELVQQEVDMASYILAAEEGTLDKHSRGRVPMLGQGSLKLMMVSLGLKHLGVPQG